MPTLQRLYAHEFSCQVILADLTDLASISGGKCRFEIRPTADGCFRFRTSQGHSEGSGVCPEAFELTLERVYPEKVRYVYHCTRRHFLLSILESGLKCGTALQNLGVGNRMHIHYLDHSTGLERDVPGVPSDAQVILRYELVDVQSDDHGRIIHPVRRAANGVLITRQHGPLGHHVHRCWDRYTGKDEDLWRLWKEARQQKRPEAIRELEKLLARKG